MEKHSKKDKILGDKKGHNLLRLANLAPKTKHAHKTFIIMTSLFKWAPFSGQQTRKILLRETY